MRCSQLVLRPAIAAIGVAALLAAPDVRAAQVTWQFGGQLDQVDTSDGLLAEFAEIAVGDRFLASFTFETTALPYREVAGAFGGVRYDFYDALLSAELTIEGRTFGREPSDYLEADSVVIRDNFADYRNGLAFPVDQPLDGISFVWSVVPAEPVASNQDSAQFRVLLRGSILDIFSGSPLPAEPDPRLLDLELTQFDVLAESCVPADPGSFDCRSDSLLGNVDRIAIVPAPSTAILLLTGCIAINRSRVIGLLRRARRAR